MTGKGFWKKVTDAWWKIVFWAKHRAGFVDLGEDVELVGTVTWTDGGGEERADNDGDYSFNVRPDPGYESLMTTFGGRQTRSENDDPYRGPTVHCEVPPWLRNSEMDERLKGVVPGVRVRVFGRWGFDGVHTGKAQWLEVLYALWGHGPDWRYGWCEIHPVVRVTVE